MIYEYQTDDGGYREVVRPMTDAPPMEFTEDGKVWKRIIGVPMMSVKGHPGPYIKGAAIPHQAVSLPYNTSPYTLTTRNGQTVREHQDGTFSTERGSRIIESAGDMQRTCDKLGMVWERD